MNTTFSWTGIVYINSLELGWATTGIGFSVLCLYVPLWFYSQREAKAKNENQNEVVEKEAVFAEISA